MFALAAVISLPTAAQSLRCQGTWVSVGENKASVISKCGEPKHKDSFCKPGRPSCETVDNWTYHPQGGFLTTLRFESGAVVSVKFAN